MLRYKSVEKNGVSSELFHDKKVMKLVPALGEVQLYVLRPSEKFNHYISKEWVKELNGTFETSQVFRKDVEPTLLRLR